MGALPLWPLDVLRQFVGLVAWADLWRRILPSVLVAGVCIVLWLGWRIWLRLWLRWLGRLRLASDRAVRLFPSLVGRISRALRRSRLPWWFQPFRRIPSAARWNAFFECEQHS